MAEFFRPIVTRQRHRRRLGQALSLVLLVICLCGGVVSAQNLSSAERAQLEAQKAQLFQRMLRNPADLDTTFAYADVSAKLGDNEAAVSALERMLLFNPNLPRVQLELGALYFRMGSYEIARSYFEKAAAASPPAEVRQRIETYLAEMGRLSAPQQFSGFLLFGVQYQSDASLAGSAIPGIQVQPQFARRADFNIFGTGSVLYSYDLGTQSADSLEVSGTGFANHFSQVSRLDLGLAETTVGPRFNFADPLPNVTGVTLKPYLIANDVSLGGNQYFHTLGVGGEQTATVFGDLRVKSTFEFRQKNFNDAPDRPLTRLFNGSDKYLSLFAAYPITVAPASELNLEFDFLDQDTRVPWYTNKTYAIAGAYRIRYDDPFGYFRRPLETDFLVSRSWALYEGVDPAGVPFGIISNRNDRRWRIGITETLPITGAVSLVLQAQRDIVSSNLPFYRYTNNIALLGPQIRF